jgi:hypothetical protein
MVKYMMEKHGRNGFLESSVTGLEALEIFYRTFWMLCCFSILKIFIFMLRKFWRQQLVLIRILVV